jgi:hypothetical protein
LKFGGRENRNQKIEIIRDEMFRMKCGVHNFVTAKGMDKYWNSCEKRKNNGLTDEGCDDDGYHYNLDYLRQF